MLLVEFFNSPEGDSSAKFTSTTSTTEGQCSSTKASTSRMVGSSAKAVFVKEDQWTGPNSAWSDGQGQWYDGVDQWHGDNNGMFDGSGSGGGGISSAPKQTSNVDLGEAADGVDKITVDVPLMIRLLEYAREDAQTDMDLHNVAEQLIALSQSGRTLSMQEYDTIVSSTSK